MADPERNLFEAHLEEYKALKNEQLKRIATRDHIYYLVIAALTAVVALVQSGDTRIHIYLAIPWLSILLGWMHIVNDQKIVSIRVYVQTKLAPALSNHCDGKEMFEWEVFKVGGIPERFKRWIFLCIKQITFVLPGCLVLFRVGQHLSKNGQNLSSVLLWGALVMEAVLLVVLAACLDRYRSIRNR